MRHDERRPTESRRTPNSSDQSLARVVDIEAERHRRLAEPWPGWWGGAGEMRTWTWAARSGRAS